MVKPDRGNYHFVMTREALATAMAATLGVRLEPTPAAAVHGGSINECYRWETERGPVFVKVAPARSIAMFEAEAAGLEELRSAGAVRVPASLGLGSTAENAWLALEWIERGTGGPATDALLGEQLAAQHRVVADLFGWVRPNTIGSTPQPNDRTRDWVDFFRERRLRFQLDLAARRGHGGRLQLRGRELLDRLAGFFATHAPAASLLHGDLWGGNRMADDLGRPVIFDPAVYYGDREADLAMTRLFGGFGPDFYRAYHAAWELDPGWEARADLYNLYHVLNHLNLFGAGYRGQALSIIDRLLAELGT